MPLTTVTATLENLLVTVKPPTFLDVGVSQAYLPWKQRLDVLLNTPQATANQLESSIWDEVNHCLIDDLKGLPYIRIENSLKEGKDKFLASTLTLPHRIGSAYLSRHKDAKLNGEEFREVLKKNINDKGIYPAIFELDPISIVFGCFLSHIQGNLRIPRVVSGQFVAENAIAMPNGGASHDPVSASGDSIKTEGYFVKKSKKNGREQAVAIKKAAEVGLGNIPYVRESYQAERYLGKFIIDTRLVDASPLQEKAKRLIAILSEYLVVKFLSEPIMLRSECYLEVVKLDSSSPLKKLEELKKELKHLISDCQKEGLVANVTTVEIPIEFKEADDDEGESE